MTGELSRLILDGQDRVLGVELAGDRAFTLTPGAIVDQGRAAGITARTARRWPSTRTPAFP